MRQQPQGEGVSLGAGGLWAWRVAGGFVSFGGLLSDGFGLAGGPLLSHIAPQRALGAGSCGTSSFLLTCGSFSLWVRPGRLGIANSRPCAGLGSALELHF